MSSYRKFTAFSLVLIAAVAAAVVAPLPSRAAAPLVELPTSAHGWRPIPVSAGSARSDVSRRLTRADRALVRRAAVQAIGARHGRATLRAEAFILSSSRSAARLTRAWPGRRSGRVAVGRDGRIVVSRGFAGVIWREGARVGLVILRQRASAGALRTAAIEDARFADGALRARQPNDSWQRVLAGIDARGRVSRSTALAAFSLAYGPLPGVRTPRGHHAPIPSGTLAALWALSYAPRLSAAQRAVIDRRLGVRTRAARAAAVPGSGGTRSSCRTSTTSRSRATGRPRTRATSRGRSASSSSSAPRPGSGRTTPTRWRSTPTAIGGAGHRRPAGSGWGPSARRRQASSSCSSSPTRCSTAFSSPCAAGTRGSAPRRGSWRAWRTGRRSRSTPSRLSPSALGAAAGTSRRTSRRRTPTLCAELRRGRLLGTRLRLHRAAVAARLGDSQRRQRRSRVQGRRGQRGQRPVELGIERVPRVVGRRVRDAQPDRASALPPAAAGGAQGGMGGSGRRGAVHDEPVRDPPAAARRRSFTSRSTGRPGCSPAAPRTEIFRTRGSASRARTAGARPTPRAASRRPGRSTSRRTSA